MIKAYADASFLFSLYVPRPQSAEAARVFASFEDPLPVTALLVYELENALRLAAWLNTRDKTKGIPAQLAQTALARLEADLDAGILDLRACDFGAVIQQGRKLSNSHTWRSGHRAFDLLHVATAKILRAKRFLTFDKAQTELALAVGLPST
jgi:predicted nucleic acid-binding protein